MFPPPRHHRQPGPSHSVPNPLPHSQSHTSSLYRYPSAMKSPAFQSYPDNINSYTHTQQGYSGPPPYTQQQKGILREPRARSRSRRRVTFADGQRGTSAPPPRLSRQQTSTHVTAGNARYYDNSYSNSGRGSMNTTSSLSAAARKPFIVRSQSQYYHNSHQHHAHGHASSDAQKSSGRGGGSNHRSSSRQRRQQQQSQSRTSRRYRSSSQSRFSSRR